MRSGRSDLALIVTCNLLEDEFCRLSLRSDTAAAVTREACYVIAWTPDAGFVVVMGTWSDISHRMVH